MIVVNVTRSELNSVLRELNASYGGNILYNNVTPMNLAETKWRVTLRVQDSHGPGAKRGIPNVHSAKGRHTISACWHVHGDFFSSLNSGAKIYTSRYGQQVLISRDSHCDDIIVGSPLNPVALSSLCDCGNA